MELLSFLLQREVDVELVSKAVTYFVMEPAAERAGTLQISNAPAGQGFNFQVVDMVPLAHERPVSAERSPLLLPVNDHARHSLILIFFFGSFFSA
jgi:hypothetical protein